jgi:hypothetical protein
MELGEWNVPKSLAQLTDITSSVVWQAKLLYLEGWGALVVIAWGVPGDGDVITADPPAKAGSSKHTNNAAVSKQVKPFIVSSPKQHF